MPSIDTIPSLYILGTSSLGMTNVPVKVTSDNDVYNYFGSTGSLVDAYRKLKDVTDYPDIYLCKINGTHSIANLNIRTMNEIIYKGLTVTSVYSSDNIDISIIITDDCVQIVSNDTVLEYSFLLYNTTQNLISAINSDAEKLICPVVITNNTSEEHIHPSFSITSCNPSVINLSEAASGINDTKLQMYYNIKASLEYLKGQQIDYIILADCYIDDEIKQPESVPLMFNNGSIFTTFSGIYIPKEIAEEDKFNYYDLLLKFCYDQFSYNIVTKAVIGFKPCKETPNIYKYSDIEAHIKTIQNKYKIDDKFLSFVSITAGDVYYDNGGTIDNHYIAYAGVISSESYSVNISNIDYGENILYRHIYTSEELNTLANSRYIIPRHSYLTGKVHIVNAVTLSKGFLSNEYVFRTIQVVSKYIKVYLDEYLGESITKSLSTKINKTLSSMFSEIVETTCATKYTYNVNYNNGDIEILCELYFPGYVDPVRFII